MNLLPPPGPQRSRQLLLLGIALAVLAFVGWRMADPGPALPAAATSNPGTPGGPAASAKLPEPLNLDALASAADEPEAGRNPFRFGVPPRPPQPAQTAAPPPAPLPPPGPPLPPAVPQIPIRFEGLLELPDGSGRKVALLADKTGATFQALEGQIVDGRYRLVRIGEESIIMEYLDGTGRRTIPIGT